MLSQVLRECEDGACDTLQSCPQGLTSWHRHHGRIGLDNICTNFMPIKVRLPKHARSLFHSYYYCLIGEGCKGRESLPCFQQWLLTLISDPLLNVFTVGNWGGSKLRHWGWQSHVTLGLFGRSDFQTHGMSFLKMVPPFSCPGPPSGLSSLLPLHLLYPCSSASL